MKIQFQQVRWFRPVGSFLHSIYLSGRKLARVADQVFDRLLRYRDLSRQKVQNLACNPKSRELVLTY